MNLSWKSGHRLEIFVSGMKRVILWLTSGFLCVIVWREMLNMEAAIERCDKLHNSGHHIEALGTMLNFKDDPNPEVQWRLARGIFKGDYADLYGGDCFYG